jgi:hypothetical protein
MTDCIPPDVIAIADQRCAVVAEFLDRMVEGIAADVAVNGPDDSVAVLALSAEIHARTTNRAGLADCLAMSIRRISALKGTTDG